MLKNVDSVLNADVLHALCSMGHGDEVVVVDAHYPALAAATQSGYGKLLTIESADSARAIKAVLSVMPLDAFVKSPAERMMVDNEPYTLPHVQREAQQAVFEAEDAQYEFAPIVRQDFYERAKKAFAVIMTGETRGWGCFILKKGLIVTPDQSNSLDNTNLDTYKV